MSTGNIISKIPTPEGVFVSFKLHGGGERTYFYDWLNGGAAILAGADPAQYEGDLGGRDDE